MGKKSKLDDLFDDSEDEDIHDYSDGEGQGMFNEDYSSLSVKMDAAKRPLWVCHNGKIILEAFHEFHAQAQDFLITIAEPVTRPERIHEFKLTAYSLYAAVSVGMQTDVILQVLDRFSKVDLPSTVVNFIKECTLSYGKVKLVLKKNRYFIESSFPNILRELLHDYTIKQAWIKDSLPLDETIVTKTKVDDFSGAVITLDREDEEGDEDDAGGDFITSFEIDSKQVEEVKKRCVELDYPLMEEYDFRQDTLNANLDMDLSPKTSNQIINQVIRDYQEKCLSKMFGGNSDGRARSGIIVLPTGAGKTLVGITAACTVKKSTIILCTNALSVEQWARELLKWSSIEENKIAKFTANSKEKFYGDAGVVISTYTMISHAGAKSHLTQVIACHFTKGKRAWDTQKMIEFVNQTEWGLMILDEVHVVPANVFRKVLTTVAAHTKLGLTATLVREDDKIEDLNFLIEANWMDLANQGYIAKIEASEVWCPMTGPFYEEYITSRSGKKRLLCAFMACEYLIKWREEQGDKILVFSDNVFALEHYAKTMGKPYIYGGTAHEERSRILDYFRQGHPSFRTIFLSKVGDTSLDLPEATCLIQISSQFGSRRQEAQRMGRILRAKRRNEVGFKSRFYTLVSKDTDEVQFSARRRRFLVDQGYEFHVIPDYSTMIPEDDRVKLHYYHLRDQKELLAIVKLQKDEVGLDEILEIGEDDLQQQPKNKKGTKTAEDKEKVIVREKKKHSLFRSWKK